MPYIILDSISQLADDHKGMIVVCGSHGGFLAAKHVLTFAPSALFCSDAGKGKDDAGIEGLKLFDKSRIPAAAVDIWSARIGDGKDIYESGTLSSINMEARSYGLSEGMTVQKAVNILIRSFHPGRY